jgi:ParB/RepB/Spo0J family partition protein
MTIAIDLIDTPRPNPCTVPVPPEADAALLASVQARGILSAILVRPAGNRFDLVFGFRRLKAARAAGLTEIPSTILAMTDLQVLEAQVIENQHRRQMHPVDQWKATADMLAAGETVADAAIALGYTERETRRMERLAALHPEVRARMTLDMPKLAHLKVIAAAPHDRQLLGLKAQYVDQGDTTNWAIVANACRDSTIPRGRAIFDVDTAGVPFQEDLFAEPGGEDQFVTADIAGFMAAQRAALAERVAKAKQKNERIVLLEWSRSGLTLPRGYTRRFDSAPARMLKGNTGPTRFVAVSEAVYDLGKVVEVIADPPARLMGAAPAVNAGDAAMPRAAALDSLSAPGQRAAVEDDPEIEHPSITNRGRQIIAAAKTTALRTHLRRHGRNASVELLGACLVAALAADNVRIADDSRYSAVDFNDLAARLIDPAGRMEIEDAPIAEILAEALARMLCVTDPVTDHGSGRPAEWIGNALEADMALPRFDTADFFRTLLKPELVQIAATADIAVPNKVTALREALAGNAPDYRPATFGAPGPRPNPAQPQRQEVDVVA